MIVNSKRCPTCNRVIYNRRRELCEFCNAQIPAHLLLSPAQRQRIEDMKTREARAHRDMIAQPTGSLHLYSGDTLSSFD